MKIPVVAPQPTELLESYGSELGRVFQAAVGPEVNGAYEHWDKVRHRRPPDGLSPQGWWLGIKLARRSIASTIPLKDKDQRSWSVTLTDSMQRRLHFIDRQAAGSIKGIDESQASQSRFLLRSLIEEAMTSSQLEGASTTRAVAKEMLSTGRQPRDQSEKMIYNNYVVMQTLRDRGKHPFSVDEILEIHSMLTEGTLEHQSECGRFRTNEDNIVIYGPGTPPTLLHVPPNANELPERMRLLCAFANGEEDSDKFVHPVVRAIALHFQIGYDHPFCDGNGRTARVLFYWAMMNAGYWLTEFLSISSALKRSPGKYLRAYLYTETDASDLSYFIDQQLETIEGAVEGLHRYIAKKASDDRKARHLLQSSMVGGVNLNHRQRALLLNALRDIDRSYTIAGHQTAHRIAYPTALTDLNTLVKAGLLMKERDGKASRYFPVPNLQRLLA